MARIMVKVSLFGLIKALMKAISMIIIFKVKEYIYGKIPESIKELGKIIKCMELALLYGPTVVNT